MMARSRGNNLRRQARCRSACTLAPSGTILPLILLRTFGSISSERMEQRRYTNRVCGFIPLSTWKLKRQRTDKAVRDGLHTYDRRHGWRGNLPNILRDHLGTVDKYQNDDWRGAIHKGDSVTGLVTAVEPTFASVKIGPYHAMLTPADFAWTTRKQPAELLEAG